ncbi:MAG TPA: sn-glycerol-3-phosphate ABC transporter ATP-binding protein UgpC [Candidatus Eisenbacteria bacterium]|jgi:multiple sugar transport system ATP-binding protein
MPGLDLQHVTKSYGRPAPAVDDVSLQVMDGELLVLVGPSGCGKSTLLRMIAGLETVTGGEIRIGERVVNDVAPRDRDIAMVFQNYALYPHMTVFDNLAFGLRRRKTPAPEVDRRVREIAEMLGLQPHLARKPRELSGGERQRVALGRAMARHPQVFLFDEPLSNLDAQLRGQMRVEIKRLHQRVKATMIYVTHDQVEAMTLGDRIAVLKAGVLQQVADPFTLYRRPMNQFVAGFIGSPPINLFAASVARDGPLALEAGGVAFPAPPALAPRLAALRGKAVRIGVRAEDLTLAATEPGGALEGRVELCEPMGGEALVHWSTPAGRLISRVAGQAPQVGEKATLHFAHSRLHLFDPETEKAIDGAS